MSRKNAESPLDYEEYDEYYEYSEALETPAARGRKPKPKRSSANLRRGIVTRARGHHFDVRLLDSDERITEEVRLCEVRGRLRQERSRDTLVAVGDYVWIAPHGAQRGQIERVEDRARVLSRQHPGVSIPAEDVILANPDQVLVVFAAAEPSPHLRMVDRFLVIAEANELPALICVNKVDLTGIDNARALFGRYAEIGYQVLYTSTETGAGIDTLREALIDQVTVLTGPSGVGKSSLLNHVSPDINARIGDLREYAYKGRHTTRGAQLYALPLGAHTFVADTPGIRELGLYDMDTQNLPFYFREFVPFLNECRYPNCTHDHEPGCAVRAALEAGKIHADRYESYLRLLHGDEPATP